MQEWEEKIIEKRRAREEGLKEGRESTLVAIKELNQKLVEAGRTDDIIKAATDIEYQKQLLQEFGIKLG